MKKEGHFPSYLIFLSFLSALYISVAGIMLFAYADADARYSRMVAEKYKEAGDMEDIREEGMTGKVRPTKREEGK